MATRASIHGGGGGGGGFGHGGGPGGGPGGFGMLAINICSSEGWVQARREFQALRDLKESLDCFWSLTPQVQRRLAEECDRCELC